MLEIASHGNMKISLNWKFGNFHVMNMMKILSFLVWKLDNKHWLNNRDRGPQERSSVFLYLPVSDKISLQNVMNLCYV